MRYQCSRCMRIYDKEEECSDCERRHKDASMRRKVVLASCSGVWGWMDTPCSAFGTGDLDSDGVSEVHFISDDPAYAYCLNTPEAVAAAKLRIGRAMLRRLRLRLDGLLLFLRAECPEGPTRASLLASAGDDNKESESGKKGKR